MNLLVVTSALNVKKKEEEEETDRIDHRLGTEKIF